MINMDDKERILIKTLNKLGVDTRYISLYEDKIYVNNLKFSRFSRKKEDEFHQSHPDIEVIRSKLFQKICIKVSRTVKNQIKPRDTLYIADDDSVESVLLKVVLEPYKRKYGIILTDNIDDANKQASPMCINDFTSNYVNQMIKGDKITNSFEEDVVYPLLHIDKSWITDWIKTTTINYSIDDKTENNIADEIIEFLDTKIPNVSESIIQSVDFLDNN